MWRQGLLKLYESGPGLHPGMGLRDAPRMQVFPLLCTGCGKPMRIIAFVTEVGSVQRILE